MMASQRPASASAHPSSKDPQPPTTHSGREKVLNWGEIKSSVTPASRFGHCSELIGNRLFIFGGMENSVRVNSVCVLDIHTKVWSFPKCDGTDEYSPGHISPLGLRALTDTVINEEPSPLPPSRMHAASFAVGTNIYVHGGEGASVPAPNENLTSDDFYLAEDEFVSKKTSYVEKMVLSDGRPPRTCLDDCWCLDTAATPMVWKFIPSKLSPLPRKYHTTAIARHDETPCVILFGGAPSGKSSPSNAIYWVKVSDLEGRLHGDVASSSSSSAFGKAAAAAIPPTPTSSSLRASPLAVASSFSASSNRSQVPASQKATRMALWSRASCSGPPPPPRYGHTCSRLTANVLCMFGGIGPDGELLNDLCLLDCENFVWSRISSWVGKEPAPRFGHKCCVVDSTRNPAAGASVEVSDCSLIVFGGACRSATKQVDLQGRPKKSNKGGAKEGHVVYSHESYSFDFGEKEWREVRSGLPARPNARYDFSLATSSEWGSASIMGGGTDRPLAPLLMGVGLTPVTSRDGGRYAVIVGGFNSMYVNSTAWALSLEWETSGVGHSDPVEYELRDADLASLVREHQPSGGVEGGGGGAGASSMTTFGQSLPRKGGGGGGSSKQLLTSASTPTLVGSRNASYDTLHSEGAATVVRFKEEGGGSPMRHTRDDMDLGFDKAAIETALLNSKREKIIAQKEAAAEKQDRIRLEDLIANLKDSVKELERQKKEAQEALGDEGKILRGQIEAQQKHIVELKLVINEQRHLMLKMDLARVQEIGIHRHAKGAERERMMHVGTDTVEEHRLVPRRMLCDQGSQVVAVDLVLKRQATADAGLEGADCDESLASLNSKKEAFKAKLWQQDLAEYSKAKLLRDGDGVELVPIDELTPGDFITGHSPRKQAIATSRSTISFDKSVTGFQTYRTTAAAGGFSATAPAALQSRKGGGTFSPPSSPASRGFGVSDTARLTEVPAYAGSAKESGAAVGGSGRSSATPSPNPFADAFENVPLVKSHVIPPTAIAMDTDGLLSTGRSSGGMSDMSDSAMGTHRSTARGIGLAARFYGRGPESHEPFVSAFSVGTKVRHCASSTIQALHRSVRLRLANRKKALERVRERKLEIAEEAERMRREAEENDEEFNLLVEQNEKLGVENVSMMYELNRLREEMSSMRSRMAGVGVVGGGEQVSLGVGGGHPQLPHGGKDMGAETHGHAATGVAGATGKHK